MDSKGRISVLTILTALAFRPTVRADYLDDFPHDAGQGTTAAK